MFWIDTKALKRTLQASKKCATSIRLQAHGGAVQVTAATAGTRFRAQFQATDWGQDLDPIAVDVESLLAALPKTPAVEIAVREGQVRVGTACLPLAPAGKGLPDPESGPAVEWLGSVTLPAVTLKEALAYSAKAVSANAAQGSLTRVLLRSMIVKDVAGLAIVGCDGHRLHFVFHPLPGEGLGKFDHALPLEAAEVLQHLCKSGDVTLKVAAGKVRATTDLGALDVETVAESYPPFEQVMVWDPANSTIRAHAALVTTLRSVAARGKKLAKAHKAAGAYARFVAGADATLQVVVSPGFKSGKSGSSMTNWTIELERFHVQLSDPLENPEPFGLNLLYLADALEGLEEARALFPKDVSGSPFKFEDGTKCAVIMPMRL